MIFFAVFLQNWSVLCRHFWGGGGEGPYIVFTSRFSHCFMFKMDYVCMYVNLGQFKMVTLKVYALQGSQSSVFAFHRLFIKRN